MQQLMNKGSFSHQGSGTYDKEAIRKSSRHSSRGNLDKLGHKAEVLNRKGQGYLKANLITSNGKNLP
jgi:hypothetical protein